MAPSTATDWRERPGFLLVEETWRICDGFFSEFVALNIGRRLHFSSPEVFRKGARFMSYSSVLKSRLFWRVVVGFVAGALLAPPQFVGAEPPKTTLASHQSQVNALQISVAELQSQAQTELEADQKYVQKTELAAFAVNWTQLTNVPPGFADGVDDSVPSGDLTVAGLIVTGMISGNGAGLSNLNAAALTNGQIPLSTIPLSPLDARYVLK
jgi:hypothetical protein